MTYEILKKNFEDAENKLKDYLHDKIVAEVEKLEELIEKAIENDIDVDETFQDIDIRLTTDSSYSDYYNMITFLCVRNEEVSVGSGVWDGDYNYDSFSTGDLPYEINEIESVLNSLKSEVKCSKQYLNSKFEEKIFDKK